MNVTRMQSKLKEIEIRQRDLHTMSRYIHTKFSVIIQLNEKEIIAKEANILKGILQRTVKEEALLHQEVVKIYEEILNKFQ